MKSASLGDKPAVTTFILQGDDPNSADYTGCTPLFAAATNGHTELVELLVLAGAKVDARDKNVKINYIYVTMFRYYQQASSANATLRIADDDNSTSMLSTRRFKNDKLIDSISC